MSVITIERKVLERNDEIAARNRALFRDRGIFAVNLLSSPGSGKTSLLERTLEAGPDLAAAVIEGDVHTDLDAQRVARYGVPVAQIVTQGGCHLEARLVAEAVERLDLTGVSRLLIENVGNLVCPAIYDLGQAANVVALSVTEGEDKPLKYPVMFHKADLVLLTKTDLLPHLPHVDKAKILDSLARTMPEPKVIEISAVTGAGVEEWIAWLDAQRAHKVDLPAGSAAHHHHHHTHG
jgi:hydrogenase nickel incorporation protein HypB